MERYVSTAAVTSNSPAAAAWFAGGGTDGAPGVLARPDARTVNSRMIRRTGRLVQIITTPSIFVKEYTPLAGVVLTLLPLLCTTSHDLLVGEHKV